MTHINASDCTGCNHNCNQGRNCTCSPKANNPQSEMTPMMMRAVQLHSELGAYATANLANAYDLFREFWRIAIEARSITPAESARNARAQPLADEVELPTPLLTVEIFHRGRVQHHQPNQNYYTADHMRTAISASQQPQETTAARDVLAERRRQVEAEDWTPEHDDEHPSGEIAAFAAVYAMPPAARDWPATETGYGDTFGEALCPADWQPKFGDRRRDLVKAGALILAEIERIDRAAATHNN